MVSFEKQSHHMLGKNRAMGYRVTHDRILLLDGYGRNHLKKQQRDAKWIIHDLSEATLENGAFRKRYPLVSDGLIVAISGESRLLMASYGKPPLGAILLRPEERGSFKFIGRSPDDTFETLDVQDGDIVIVGPLDQLSKLESGALKLNASSTLAVVSGAIYNSTDAKTLCIVATISITPKPAIINVI
jgi:hypothetical protein